MDERTARLAQWRAAYNEGKASFVAGGPRRNPYSGLSTDRVERWSAYCWAHGWMSLNPFRAGGPHDPFRPGNEPDGWHPERGRDAVDEL